jgi:hypothetical protein
MPTTLRLSTLGWTGVFFAQAACALGMKIMGDAAAAPRRAALFMNVLRDIFFIKDFFNPLFDQSIKGAEDLKFFAFLRLLA